ncbi:hypothetical protein EYF80_008154 [Liparis tanakae]|uniref:Uncharacterized protein n=1 Tax=Liparis tanakae TaxID=230148 RepID=A0A4Z2IW19_9TELE|nr:hypothetical protein EYF80_008154 [Liparis tanakae]
MSTCVEKRTGLNTVGGREGDEVKIERRRASPAKDKQREKEERLVEKKTPNVILHSLHGVEGRRERGGEKRGRSGGSEREEEEEEEKRRECGGLRG